MAVLSLSDVGCSQSYGKSSPRINAVLLEIVRRHRVFLHCRKSEFLWRVLLVAGVLISVGLLVLNLSSLAQLGKSSMQLLLAFVVCDSLIYRKLYLAQRAVQKAAVNYGVVRHHLIGMLDIKFCDCRATCTCSQELRRTVLERYGISLY